MAYLVIYIDRMNKKQIQSTNTIAFTLFLMVVLFITQSSLAQSPTRAVLREQRKELIQEKKDLVKEKTTNVLERVKNVVKEKIKRQIKGTLVAIVGNTLTVQKDQTNFTVTTTDKTELKRRFGATSSLSEFSPNDELLIIGNRKKNTDGTFSSSEIEASYIRNMSIQRRFAVFNGTVVSVSTNSLVLQTKSRGIQTVYVYITTQYKEKNTSISFNDIQVDDNLIVKGELWDRVNDKMDAKTILRLTNRLTPATSIKPTQAKD